MNSTRWHRRIPRKGLWWSTHWAYAQTHDLARRLEEGSSGTGSRPARTDGEPESLPCLTSPDDLRDSYSRSIYRRLSHGESNTIWHCLMVAAWVAAIYLIVNLVLPRIPQHPIFDLYIERPILWLTLAAFCWRAGLIHITKDQTILLAALALGTVQAVLNVSAGFVYGFGQSPYNHTPLSIAANLFYMSSALIGWEFSRMTIIEILRRWNPTGALLAATFLFTLSDLSAGQYQQLALFPEMLDVLAEHLLPAFAENLLASYLVITGGALPAILYRGVLQSFEWLPPILPDIPPMTIAFLGTVTPGLGVLIVQIAREAGEAQAETQRRTVSWNDTIMLMVVGLALLWLNAGYFGFQPSLISGSSMVPTLKMGDLVIVQRIARTDVREGDIIRYYLPESNTYVIHRVVEVGERSTYFVTKGDNNNTSDPPVIPTQLRGEVISVIPKVGWLAIWMKQAVQGPGD